jgi:glycosyltransferase involved in cell wall biosynthesis
VGEKREPIVLGAGRLVHQKGFDRLIEAFAGLGADFPEWELRIAGAGPRRASLARLSQQSGANVALLGRVHDMAGEYARASIFVLSSRFEGFPMVLLEAMSHGVPVVSMDCPTGPATLIEPGVSGLLTRRDDIPGLGAGIRTLMEDARLRAELAAAARERVSRFSIDPVAGQWRELFAQLGRRSRS